MDDLFEQFANISKAQGYDILSKQVEELKAIIMQLIEVAELDTIQFTALENPEKFKTILNKAKLLSL